MREKVLPIPQKMLYLMCLLFTATLALNFYETAMRSVSNPENSSNPQNLLAAGLTSIYNPGENFHDEDYAGTDQLATIAATKMNVLYTGFDNPISVSVSGVKPENVHLTVTGGSITGSMGHYGVIVQQGAETVSITATSKKDGAGKVFGTVKFRVRDFPKLEVTIGNIHSPLVTVEELKAAREIRAIMNKEVCLEGITYQITGYDIMHVPKKGNPTPVRVEGDLISPVVSRLFERVVPGDQIIVYDMKAKGPSGDVLITTSILLTVR